MFAQRSGCVCKCYERSYEKVWLKWDKGNVISPHDTNWSGTNCKGCQTRLGPAVCMHFVFLVSYFVCGSVSFLCEKKGVREQMKQRHMLVLSGQRHGALLSVATEQSLSLPSPREPYVCLCVSVCVCVCLCVSVFSVRCQCWESPCSLSHTVGLVFESTATFNSRQGS